MTGVAAGLYLIGLRKRESGLTRIKLANELDIDLKRLERWEKGENRPSINAIRPVLERIGGAFDEFTALWENAPGTAEDAEEAIKRTLGSAAVQSVNQAADNFAAALNPDELSEVIDLAQHLSKEDRKHWLEIGRRFWRGGRSDD